MDTKRKTIIQVVIGGVLLLMVARSVGLLETGFMLSVATIYVLLAGVVPFVLGIVIQVCVGKQPIPAYVAWVIAGLLTGVLSLSAGTTGLRVLDSSVISIIVSVCIMAVFLNSGFKSCRAFKEGRNSTIG